MLVYCYAPASRLWWDGIKNKLERARNLRVIHFPAEQAQALAELARRSMSVHVNVQDGEAYVSTDDGQVTVQPEAWR